LGLLKLTGPDPLTRLQLFVSRGGAGSPSSLTVPDRYTEVEGKVIVCGNPAFTTGGVFCDCAKTVTLTSALVDN
jgi:hypothetical protein